MDFARSVENDLLQNSLRKVVHGNVELCRVGVDQSERSMWRCVH